MSSGAQVTGWPRSACETRVVTCGACIWSAASSRPPFAQHARRRNVISSMWGKPTLHCNLVTQAAQRASMARYAVDARQLMNDPGFMCTLHDSCLQVTAAAPSFEEVALRLLDSGDAAALRTFLLTKLQVLGPQDRAQVPAPARDPPAHA